VTLNKKGINFGCYVIIVIYDINHGYMKLNDHFESNNCDL